MNLKRIQDCVTLLSKKVIYTKKAFINNNIAFKIRDFICIYFSKYDILNLNILILACIIIRIIR